MLKVLLTAVASTKFRGMLLARKSVLFIYLLFLVTFFMKEIFIWIVNDASIFCSLVRVKLLAMHDALKHTHLIFCRSFGNTYIRCLPFFAVILLYI